MEQKNAISVSRSARWSGLYLVVIIAFAQICSCYDLVHSNVADSAYYKELGSRHILVVDELHAQILEKRQTSSDETNSSTTFTTTSDTGTTLPLPFDTSLGTNFTATSCPDYFDKFLADNTFLSCLPVSLLLQNSISFFQAVRSSSLLERTLDTSCSASLAVCTPLMNKLADELILEGNCRDDYLRRNPLVMQAYVGLKAYEPLYQATCLRDPSTTKYCFLEAMESEAGDDSYPYYTAIGLALPLGTKPQCTACLKQTMELFSGYTMQQEQPLAGTYLGCATQVNTGCGPGFANTQVKSVSKVASTSGTSMLAATSSLAILLPTSLFVLCMSW